MQLFNLNQPFLPEYHGTNQPLYIKSCLVISSAPSSISRFNRFIEGIKETWQLSEDGFENIRITVFEAVTNAIIHGNKSETEKMVFISALRNGALHTFTIEDEGEGFNFENLENPLSAENLTKSGGRGIFIMKHLSDAVHFSKKGKCVKLHFGLNKFF
jgi:serine/threonine-protein kinase RsbW